MVLISASKATIPHFCHLIIQRDPVLHEDPLHESVSGPDLHGLALVAVIRELCEDMPLIVRIIIITVNDADRIVKLEPELKSKPAPRVALEHSSIVYFNSNTSWNFDC